MRYWILVLPMALVLSCGQEEGTHGFTEVRVDTVFEDSLNIRALEILPGSVAFGADKGVFGAMDLKSGRVRTRVIRHDSLLPEFRAVAQTSSDVFLLSVASPALLYKTGDEGEMEVVYSDTAADVFYDAMAFWNDAEGLAVGDYYNGCMAFLTTRDGGRTWKKTACAELPASPMGEGAFAASNSNIAIKGDNTWVATSASRIFYSPDKGASWRVVTTPVSHSRPTQGIFSIDFYDRGLGVAMGGDYARPEINKGNKAMSTDGGKSWRLIADGQDPAYVSCVRFVPHSGGMDIVSVGFSGISYSGNGGQSWDHLSRERFYTLRFLNDSVAYAAGKGRIARLRFR